VRVKNTGTAASSNFYVRSYLTHFAGSQFQYPDDYITSINTGDPIPNPLVQGTYLIGEQFVASLGAGTTDIYTFLWESDLVPPEDVGGTLWHPCLLAEVSPHTGPTPTGDLVVDNTNLAQRNIGISYSEDDGLVHQMTGVIGHEKDDSRIKRIVILRGRLPKSAQISVRFLDPKVERAVIQTLSTGGHTTDKTTTFRCCCLSVAAVRPKSAGNVEVRAFRGHRVFQLISGSRLELEIPMAGGRLTPIVLGIVLPKGTNKGDYEVPLFELDASGRPLGAFALQVTVR